MLYLANLDLNKNQLLNAALQKLALAPVDPVTGQVYFNTEAGRAFLWTGTAWIGMDSVGATMTAENIVASINGSTYIIDDDNLSPTVRDVIAASHTSHTIANVTGLQGVLDGKVDDGQVLTDVPENAKFTDTITSINGKTGTIVKADIVALGIPAQDTTYANATTSVAGLMSNTDKTKLDGVATNANNYSHPTGDGNLHVPLTGTGNNGKVLKAGPTAGSLIWADDIDTKYTAGTGLTLTGTVFTPTFGTTVGTVAQGNDARFTDARTPKSHSHPISDVTSLQTALDGKVDDGQVLTDVPAGAIFTDTVTSINGKTGVIAKADITALGIPAQDTTYGVFSTSANGLVPKTTTSNTTDYLRRDGSWAAPPDTKYTLPTASASVLGGVKSGTDITIDASGNVSVNDDSHNHTIANVDGLQTALDAKETPGGATAKASTAENNAKSYTDTKLAALVDSSPAALDTLNELATALGNDPNFATSMTTMISQKTNKYTTTVASATAVVITHNLNTRDVIVQLRDTASPYAIVMTDVEITSVNTITLKFAVAPAASAYTVTVIG